MEFDVDARDYRWLKEQYEAQTRKLAILDSVLSDLGHTIDTHFNLETTRNKIVNLVHKAKYVSNE